MVSELKKEGTSALSKMIAQKLEEQLIQGESFSTALEKMKLFRQEFIWLVLEGEKTRQLDVQLQVYADQMLDEFTQGIEKKSSGFNRYYLWGLDSSLFPCI